MESRAVNHNSPLSVFLGLDIGTSKAAAVLIDMHGNVLAAASRAYPNNQLDKPGRAEQPAHELAATVWNLVRELPAPLRAQVAAIGVTGQMHGVLMLDDSGQPTTPLVNWQDARCLEDPAFLPQLQRRTKHELRTGFGCATLAWRAAHQQVPVNSASAATIHDWIVAQLCGQSRAVTDPTDAASWGCFDLRTSDWDWSAIAAAGIARSWMPVVQPCGSRAGKLCDKMAQTLALPAGVAVATAIGDNQASLFATLGDPERELALTLGTGGQVSAVLPAGAPWPDPSPRYECRPYPGGRVAVVASALCGGAAWAWLMRSAAMWLEDLKIAPLPSDEQIYAQLNALGLAATTEVTVHPSFLGERFDPHARGVIGGLTVDGLRLGSLARGLARGIVTNLRDMLPPEILTGRTRVVGSGNALRRSELLQQMTASVFDLPVHLPNSREEAATGAARLASALVTE